MLKLANTVLILINPSPSNVKDNNGRTGFHQACYFGYNEVVDVIICNSKSFDFNLTAQNFNDETGFQLAKRHEYLNIINIIKNERPDILHHPAPCVLL